MASSGSPSLALNVDYVKSRSGILRIAEACVGLCAAICVSQGYYCGNYGMYSFYNFVAVTTLIIAVLVIVLYIISLDKLCPIINFPLSIFINDLIFSICYLVATILMFVAIFTCRHGQAARIFAAIFGILGTIVVGLLAFYGYQVFRGSQTGTAAKTDAA